MKGLFKTAKGKGNVEVRECPEPKLRGEDWVKIKVKAAGVCGTDLHIWHDLFPYWPPVIMGHEFSGEIVEVGSEVKKFAIGDKVVAEPHSFACGTCYLCRTGKIQLCPDKRSPGWGFDGAFAPYVVMPEKLLHKIPEGLAWDIAALAEPMAITVHQVTERCGIDCGDTVVVTGAGPIGIMCAFVAKQMGAGKVIITGLESCEKQRFPVALALGADIAVNVQKQNPVDVVMELTDGIGADKVIETSGSGAGISSSIEMLKKCGKLCAIGMGADMSNVPWKQIVLKSLDVVGCMSSSYTSWDKALRLMANTDKDLGMLITHRTSIDEWESVFNDLTAENGIKAMFIPEEA